MKTVMDVLNRLSLNARVMDKIIKLFYKSVVLYDEICKDQEETAEDLLLMKIQTIKKFDHDWREYLYKNPEAKESGPHQTSTWVSCAFSTWRRQAL